MRIFVTGGTGFLGRHVVEQLKGRGHEAVGLGSKNVDLTNFMQTEYFLNGAEVVIHLAAKVGGIGANQQYPGEFFYENLMMGVNVVRACQSLKIPRLVLAGTVCSYPCYTPSPFNERDFWNGYPESTNAPYGVAKKAVGEMCEAYRLQYGLRYCYLLPCNLYGRGDNYKTESSHVIPAAIRKFDVALKMRQTPTFWGTGSATREFLNVRDAARAFVLAAESAYVGGPVNIGNGNPMTIRETVRKVGNLMGYEGPVLWDSTKPDGQPHRMLDCSLAKRVLNWEAQTPFEDGLKEALADYRERFGE
jgi:GDP-L-fucose synthase